MQMQFQYTPHAEKKLLARGLDKKQVEDAINNPESIYDSRFNRKIASKTIGNKVLLVIYEQERHIYIIITAYYIEKGRYG